MPTELYEGENVFAPAFAFDADLQWAEVSEFEVTDRKVEAKGSIADYIASKPHTATVEGKVTAMTVEPAPPDPQKLVSARDRLVELGDKRAIVLVLSEMFAGYMAIQRVEISKGVDDGGSFTARIALKKIETTTTATAQVPASRLRPKVKRRKGPGKRGGAARGSRPPSNQTYTLRKLLAAGVKIPP